MKNIIVNLNSKNDLYEKYSNGLSRDLVNYLVREAKYADSNIKITINTNLEVDNLEMFVKRGLEEAYKETKKIDKIHNIKQFMFFIIGLVFLILSTMGLFSILKEIIIIAGWVAIWEVVDISLNVDSELKLSRTLIRKLINSKFEINKI